MLLLAIGDLHIPDRALELPAKFKKLLAPGKISQVLCLGNITTSQITLEFLKNLSPDFQLVKGEFDENQSLPLHSIVSHDGLKIGFTNGHTVVPQSDPLALLTLARQLDVDILLWGGTHRIEAYTLDGKFFINPGSATGAYSMGWPEKEENEKEEEKEEDEQTSTEKSETEQNDEETENKDEEEYIEPIEPIPSFCLLDIQGVVCTLYIYTYLDGEVKVDKVSYRKETN